MTTKFKAGDWVRILRAEPWSGVRPGCIAQVRNPLPMPGKRRDIMLQLTKTTGAFVPQSDLVLVPRKAKPLNEFVAAAIRRASKLSQF
jgi:hypothetical protein